MNTVREVETIVIEGLKAGNNQTTFDARKLSGGTYCYRISPGNYVETRKMLLVQ